MSHPFQKWSKDELVIYCYDNRPELYTRLTAQTRPEDILGWLTPPPQANEVDLGEGNKFKQAKVKRVKAGHKGKKGSGSNRVTFGKRNDFSGAEIEDITAGDELA